MSILKNIIFLFIFFIAAANVNAQSQSLKVGNLFPGQLDMGAFHLSKKSTIEIKGLAASFDEWEKYLSYFGWIVETESRNVVWKTTMCEDYEEEDGEFEIEKDLRLDAGNYEVYFSAGYDYKKFKSFDYDRFMGSLFGMKEKADDDFRDDFFIYITGGKQFKIVDPEDLVDERNKNAIVAITRVGDYENIERKFSLSDDTKLYIYGLGEGVNKQFYDFGYIYDVANNERVWMFNKNDAKKAGGGYKNRKVQAKLKLPKGSYYVKYVTDDSHSFDEWNVLPPEDPQYWGITIFPAESSDAKNVIPFREIDVIEPIINITKVNDDELRLQGFTLTKDMKIRVFSVGEGMREMADYGWIINADTRETVWKMTKRNTEYAGGSKKNRMVDENVNLKQGNYIAYYVTDDSHSYMNWNEAPPYQSEDWGIKIWTVNKDDQMAVTLFDAENYVNDNLIVEILRVGDDELVNKNFNLDAKSKIRIVAIGEGRGNEMYDYGWIEDFEGNVVWKMKYHKTSHAGGANKNRECNEVIVLPKGEYKVFYRTDDSHSYPDWNSTPPDEKENYGITILLE